MCTVVESKKKKEFFIRPVNKIIKSLPLISITLSSLSQSLSHLISSLKTLSSKLLFRRRSPHLISSHASRRLASHLISRRRLLAHQTAGLKLIKPPIWNPWSSPTLCLFVIGDFLFCLWLMILFGLDWEKILEIWVFFFYLLWTGGGVGGGCGCGCVCGCGWW